MVVASAPATRPLVVHKYGGSSVGSPDKIVGVARRVAASRKAGADVVVVVSAMGGTTDKLLDLARAVTTQPPARELDALLSTGEGVSTSLLAMALESLGCPAVSLSGYQCRIVTDGNHGQARICDIDTRRIRETVAKGNVAVVAGFQGINETGDVTTLGRGGSDTSAVALAAALGAERCDIFSDVAGVFSADPRVVSDARRLDELCYEEMAQLARFGARVLAAEAVELAHEKRVTICARSTFGGPESTVIRHISERPETGFRVAGVAGSRKVLRVRCEEVAKRQLGAALSDLDVLAHSYDKGNMDALVSTSSLPSTAALEDKLTGAFDGVKVCSDVGSVAAVGFGVGTREEAAATALSALKGADVPVMGGYRHPEALSYLVPAQAVSESMRAVHDAFLGTQMEAA